jgi:hypothetical protein
LIVRNVWDGINRQFGDIINPNDEQKRNSDEDYFFIVYTVRYNFTYQNNTFKK